MVFYSWPKAPDTPNGHATAFVQRSECMSEYMYVYKLYCLISNVS